MLTNLRLRNLTLSKQRQSMGERLLKPVNNLLSSSLWTQAVSPASLNRCKGTWKRGRNYVYFLICWLIDNSSVTSSRRAKITTRHYNFALVGVRFFMSHSEENSRKWWKESKRWILLTWVQYSYSLLVLLYLDIHKVELSLNEKKKKNLYVFEEEVEETKRRKWRTRCKRKEIWRQE